MTDAEKVKEAYALLRSVNDQVVRFFTVAWGTIPSSITAGDRMIVEQMLKSFCYEAVRDAFLEARAQGKQSLSYVRTVAQNMNEKIMVERSVKEAKEKAKDIALLSGENIRAKPDIKDNGWKIGLLTENLQNNMIKEVFKDAKEL